MNMADQIVNGNGTSSIALAFFSIMIPLLVAIATGIFKLLGQNREAKYAADKAADKASVAADNSKKAADNTRSVSNGFAGDVVRKLDHIIETQDRIIERQNGFDESLREHLSWHLDTKA